VTDDYVPPRSIAAPTLGVDPRVALATAIHASPGVYAVLVGSGMSRAAGISTGWQVVQDLIRNAAVAEGVDLDDLGITPEQWWEQGGRSAPRYDTVLPALASTDAARQSLLRGYFDPPPTSGQAATPTAAHAALARLCAAGQVRLILTTNFDRLTERALDQAGLSPQVISSTAALTGMTPLTHAPLTVIKLHGDYAMLGLRNTPEELGDYPAEWKALLERVFDEFGLLVTGWSAEYDTALVEALARNVSRRYPIFWTAYGGQLTESARRLIDLRKATVIDITGADEFFVDLGDRLGRLDQIAARRGRPTPLRTYVFPPEQSTAPQGWAVLPLLQLRAVAALGPATLDTCGLIQPQHRDLLVGTLRLSAVAAQLRAFSARPAASATTEATTAVAAPLVDWEPTPGHQSTEYASYRLGGDATGGVSCLVSTTFPGYGVHGSVVFKVDMALSLANTLRLGDVARLLRDALVLASASLPEVFVDILPVDAELHQVEVHLLAPSLDGTNRNRPNELLQRVDLSQIGAPTRAVGPLMGFAARISSPLTDRDAAELVVQAIEYMVLAYGYLDPRLGITLLRQEMGVAP
jgi:hypothetical protein